MTERDNLKKGYLVGYCKPPVHSRFKKGVCPNPKGRGKAKFVDIGQTHADLIEERVKIKFGAKTETATRREAQILMWVREAMRGQLSAAEMIADLLMRKKKARPARDVQTRYEKDVMRELEMGLLPKNTIIRRDYLIRYAKKKPEKADV